MTIVTISLKEQWREPICDVRTKISIFVKEIKHRGKDSSTIWKNNSMVFESSMEVVIDIMLMRHQKILKFQIIVCFRYPERKI